MAPLNVRLDSLTAERAEADRLKELEATGHFQDPAFPILEQFRQCNPVDIFVEVKKHQKRFAAFAANAKDPFVYSFDNVYYTSPDAEVLYSIVRLYDPACIVEIGSGYSTRLFRQAIADGALCTKLTSVDPRPRCELSSVPDLIVRSRVEMLGVNSCFLELKANDILFIDSSHEIKTGNDVIFLFLNILPVLESGVLVHIHDVFLPYEYPAEWVIEEKWGWTEQYLVQAMLQGSHEFDVLWSGYYLQRCWPNFNELFPHRHGGIAKSLWLRKR